VEPNFIIFLDSNIWRKERLLKSSIGAAFLYAIRRTGGKIGLPHVTEVELIMGASRDGLEAVKSIKSGFATIQTLIGTRPDYSLPIADDFEEEARKRIAELNDLIIKYDHSLEQYHSALARVVQGTSPNRTREQFRDTLLWESIVVASTDYQIGFVTNDLDFYQEKMIEKGLAKDLHDEITSQNGKLCCYRNLDEYLAKIKDEIPPLDYKNVAKAISSEIYEEVLQDARKRDLSLSSLGDSSLKAFLTERTDVLAITYELRYCIDVEQSDLDLMNSLLYVVIFGNCFYHLVSGEITNPTLNRIEYQDQDEQRVPAMGTVYLKAGGISLGTQYIPFTIRRKLDED
jgi:hypothetical protein